MTVLSERLVQGFFRTPLPSIGGLLYRHGVVNKGGFGGNACKAMKSRHILIVSRSNGPEIDGQVLGGLVRLIRC